MFLISALSLLITDLSSSAVLQVRTFFINSLSLKDIYFIYINYLKSFINIYKIFLYIPNNIIYW